MGKWESCISSRIYIFRRQFPMLDTFGKSMHIVKKELNKDCKKKKSACNDCRRPMEKCCVKNRQKP